MKTRLVESFLDKDIGLDIRLKSGFSESALHGHDFYELDLILGGENRTCINREDMICSRGNVFFLTPEDFHEYGEDGRLDILNIHFTEDLISDEVLGMTVNSGLRCFKIGEKHFVEMERLSRLLLSQYQDGAGVDILSRLLECLLLLLLKEGNSSQISTNEKCTDIQKAIIYIGTHFKDNPSLTEVASTIPLNERYFCLKFKEYTGKTYKEYLKNLKLRYARRLILASNYSMLEVAEKSGYMTQSHFNREFKSEYGITPSELRNDK